MEYKALKYLILLMLNNENRNNQIFWVYHISEIKMGRKTCIKILKYY